MRPRERRRWWVRFEEEARACPACRSSRITVLDVFSIPRTPEGRRLAFISGCHACGVLFVNPLPTTSQLERYYSEAGTWASRQAGRVKATRTQRRAPAGRICLLSALERHAPQLATSVGRVLDFGCGDGKFLNRMKARGWTTYGIEPSTDAAFRKHHRLAEVPQDRVVRFRRAEPCAGASAGAVGGTAAACRFASRRGPPVREHTQAGYTAQHRDLKYCLSGHRHVVSFSEVCLRGLLARAGFDNDRADRRSGAGRGVYRGAAAAPSSRRGTDVRSLPRCPHGRFAAARHALAGYLRRSRASPADYAGMCRRGFERRSSRRE